MHFHFASLIWMTYASDIDWTLTLIGITIIGIIAINIAVAADSSIWILDAVCVDIFLVDLPYNLLHLLLLRDVILADFTTLVISLILFVFSYQVLQISFILTVICVTLALSYLGIVALKCGSTFIGYWSGDGIVSDWVVGVLTTSSVVFAWCILSMLNWEHVVHVHLWVGRIDHVEVVLVALAHCVFRRVHDCLLLVGAVSSQRLLIDWRLLVGLILRVASLTLIGGFRANDLLL